MQIFCMDTKRLVYNKTMFPAVFLDRDGVLIENRSEYVREWSQVSIFPFTISALTRLAALGYKIVVVTNQSAIGRGLLPVQVADEINQKLVDIVRAGGGQVDAVYVCPHHPDEICSCRKPNPGMLLQAADEHSLDISRSWMIGDAWTDIQAGHAAQVPHLGILKTGRGHEQLLLPRPAQPEAFHIFDNLAEAVGQIAAAGSV